MEANTPTAPTLVLSNRYLSDEELLKKKIKLLILLFITFVHRIILIGLTIAISVIAYNASSNKLSVDYVYKSSVGIGITMILLILSELTGVTTYHVYNRNK